MLDWLGSVQIRKRTSTRVELDLTRATAWTGWGLAAGGAWLVSLGAAVGDAARRARPRASAVLLGTLRRRLVFDRDEGLLRSEQRILGIRRRARDPAVPPARGRGRGAPRRDVRRVRRAPGRRHDPPRRGPPPGPAARARGGDRRGRRAAARVRRDDAGRGIRLSPQSTAGTVVRLDAPYLACPSLLLAARSPASRSSGGEPQPKTTEQVRKLAGVYPENFTLRQHRDHRGARPAARRHASASSTRRRRSRAASPHPCTYEVAAQRSPSTGRSTSTAATA